METIIKNRKLCKNYDSTLTLNYIISFDVQKGKIYKTYKKSK